MNRMLFTCVAFALAGCCGGKSREPVDSFRVWTESHRNHLYVLRAGGYFIHSPECLCHNTKVEASSD